MSQVTKIIHDESVRLLEGQAVSLDGLRNRAGTLLAAASLVTAFLAPPALRITDKAGTTRYHFTTLTWAALATFVGLTIAALAVLVPRSWTFGHDAHDLMDKFLESDPPGDEEQLYYHLAYYNEEHHRANAKKMNGLFAVFGVGCALLAAELGLLLAAVVN